MPRLPAFTKPFAIALATLLGLIMPVQNAMAQCAGCMRVAVMPFDSDQSCQYYAGEWGSVLNCNAGWQSFREMLETSVTASRKLQVIDRVNIARQLNEQAVQSCFRSACQRFNFTSAPADYLVYGKITELGYENNRYEGREFATSSLKGTFAVDVKFMETRTGKIFHAASIRVDETMQSNYVNNQGGGRSSGSSLGALYGKLQRAAATRIAAELMAQVYPIRVARRMGDQLILSYGSAILPVGTVVEVMGGSANDCWADMDTGRRICGGGAPVATLEVTSATIDYSTAMLRSGDLATVQTGARVQILGNAGTGSGDSAGGGYVPWPSQQ